MGVVFVVTACTKVYKLIKYNEQALLDKVIKNSELSAHIMNFVRYTKSSDPSDITDFRI